MLIPIQDDFPNEVVASRRVEYGKKWGGLGEAAMYLFEKGAPQPYNPLRYHPLFTTFLSLFSMIKIGFPKASPIYMFFTDFSY